MLHFPARHVWWPPEGTLWVFNIAVENDPFMIYADLPI